MNLNLSIIAQPAVPANYLIGAIYDPSAPTVVVQWIALAKPYTGAPITITFTGLNVQVYNFILWENTTAVVGGVSRNNFSINPTQNTVQVRADLYLICGTSLGFTVGASTYTDSSLSGWSYDAERKGIGTMVPGTDYATTDTSFSLLASGDVFGIGEVIILRFLPKTSQISAPAPSPFISASRTITTNTALDNTDLAKGILIQGAAAAIVITLPGLSTVSDNKPIYLFSAGGSHINAVIQCAGADALLWPFTKLILGQYENAVVYKANGVWNVGNASEGALKAGETFDSYVKNPATMINTVFANGSLLSRANYPRLWAFVQTLESAALVADSAWANTDTNGNFINKAKYSSGDGSTNFRIPLLTLYGFTRGVDGSTRYPGDLELGNAGEIDIVLPKGDGYSGGTPTPGRFAPGQASHPQGTTLDNTIVVNAGQKPRPYNSGVYKLIRI